MGRHLLIAVHLHADGMGTARYHGMSQGAPEWPPAAARVFQALVAGVARGQTLPETFVPALQWLERLPPPLIAAPLRSHGQSLTLFVPNNDADALADPSDVSSIRTAKQVQPSLFDGAQPLLYVWGIPEGDVPEMPLTNAAHLLYQLGRGVDMAWADLQVLDNEALQALLMRYRGVIHQPSEGPPSQRMLSCPVPGTLASLVERHGAPRLRTEAKGPRARALFTNAPKPRFASVSYAPQRWLTLFELRDGAGARPWPWPQHRAATLVERIRDAAAVRLLTAVPEATVAIERSLLGRAADGSGAVALTQRVRIVPLPSIGSVHVDQAIRRVLIEVPSGCPVARADLDWALSGLQGVEPETGELSAWALTRAEQFDMQKHYCQPSRHWLSVTPVVLPQQAAGRRTDPGLRQAQAGPAIARQTEAKRAGERQAEEGRALAAVHQALRHAGIPGVAVQVRVQREAFSGRGRRADAFADDTRFAKQRLWHVAVSFDRPVSGPLVIGDGRFVGLGLLAPAAPVSGFSSDPAAWTDAQSDGVAALRVVSDKAASPGESLAMARALRRAVMARVSDATGSGGEKGLSAYFSGHAIGSAAPDGQPSRHLAYHWDGPRLRWLVLAPHRLEHRRAFGQERAHLAVLDQALDGMDTIRAGGLGIHAVERVLSSSDDPVLATAMTWESVTPYVVTRHRRLACARDALIADVLAECRRCNLPQPRLEVLACLAVPGHGLQGRLRLQFSTAVAGPVVLGRSSLLGGGLFAATAQQAPDAAMPSDSVAQDV
jgi:CRISPR-associated protein Csb2